MIVETIAAIVALLAAVLPPILAAWARQAAVDRKEADALVRRSLDELHVATDRVRAQRAQKLPLP